MNYKLQKADNIKYRIVDENRRLAGMAYDTPSGGWIIFLPGKYIDKFHLAGQYIGSAETPGQIISVFVRLKDKVKTKPIKPALCDYCPYRRKK